MTTVSQWLADHPQLQRIDAELLLAESLNVNRAHLIAYPARELNARELSNLRASTQRLSAGEPLAYITGVREFWGLEFEVSPDVLVPRPETELLVEITARDAGQHARVLDLGTGSGAIAVALSTERPDLHITATDHSIPALRVAARNASKHTAQLKVVASDWFGAINAEFDIIACNPPYVRADDPHLANLSYEPQSALVAGADGLEAIRQIVASAPDRLAPSGVLMLEHGYDQASAVRELMVERGFTDVGSRCDLSRIERVTLGRWGCG